MNKVTKIRTKKTQEHLTKMKIKMMVQISKDKRIKKKGTKQECKSRVATQIDRIMIQANFRLLVEKNVLINYVIQRKYLKKLGQKWKSQGTDFFVKTVMTIMSIILFASFVNKSTPIMKMKKMTLNGSVVTNVKDG